MATETDVCQQRHMCDNMATDIYLRQHICATNMAKDRDPYTSRETNAKKVSKGTPIYFNQQKTYF